jgi:hypothetical protein
VGLVGVGQVGRRVREGVGQEGVRRFGGDTGPDGEVGRGAVKEEELVCC